MVFGERSDSRSEVDMEKDCAHPAVLAISIALLVIAGVFAFHLLGQLMIFRDRRQRENY